MKPILDPDDEHIWAAGAWKPHAKGSSYFKRRIGRKPVFLHRIVAGAKKGELVDHINGNPLDCRKANLRICNFSESNANRKAKCTSRAPYKGITQTPSGRWLAQISIRKVYHRLGLFDTAEEAAAAYDQAAKFGFGDFARINNITAIGCS